jgi:phage terminase large subunit GpA-like protein
VTDTADTLWLPAECDAWRPPRQQSVSEWADENRVLSRLVSAEPGPWRTDRTPYLREIQDAFRDRTVEQVTLRKSTQVGGTEAFHNVIGWTVSENPVPIVLVLPRDADVDQQVSRRLKPMFEESPRLSEEITGWSGDWKVAELAFRRCVLYGRASNSAAALASVAGGLLVGDECDKWPRYTGKEASPWDLAKERTRTFPSRKIGLVSTPTVPEGLISVEFEAGDRRRYWVPCPHCDEYQVLEWGQVRWDLEQEGDPRRLKANAAAWYECPHCGERIDDVHKRRMLAAGVWVPEAGRLEVTDLGVPVVVVPDDVLTDHRSYHLWSGYSPWLTWAEIVATWLLSRDTDAGRQNFTNSWLGEPWREVVAEPTPEGVGRRVRGYERDTLPDAAEPVAITMGVDVQKTELPYAIRAWGADGDSWLLRYGLARSWDVLEGFLDTEWHEGHRIDLACIDSRYRTDEVYEFARERLEQVRAIKGVAGDAVQLFHTTKVDRHPLSGAPLRSSLIVWNVRVDSFRDRLAKALNDDGDGGWQVHASVSTAYLRQLQSQEKVAERAAGGRKARQRWRTKAGHRHDHAWDCEVYNLVGATMLGVDRVKSTAARAEQARSKLEAIRERKRQTRRSGGGFLDDLRGSRP